MGSRDEGVFYEIRKRGAASVGELEGLAEEVEEVDREAVLDETQIADEAVVSKGSIGVGVLWGDLQEVLFGVDDAAGVVLLYLALPLLGEDEAKGFEQLGGLFEILEVADCAVEHGQPHFEDID